jgi:hypothetical protein
VAVTKRIVREINEMKMAEYSPEKAGVGGSIPSLATTFSSTYRLLETQFHSISFQNFWPDSCRR